MPIIPPRRPARSARRTGASLVIAGCIALAATARGADDPSALTKPPEAPGTVKPPAVPAVTKPPEAPAVTKPPEAPAVTKPSEAPTGKQPSEASAKSSPKQRPSMTPTNVVHGGSLAAEKAAIDGVTAKTTIDEILAWTLPRRGDRPGDWFAGAEPLHHCGEPRWIEPCIPPPPCHPSYPPAPWDLLGVAGDPTCGPIYRGPCCPRTGSHDDGPLPGVHRLHDRFFDAFYRTK